MERRERMESIKGKRIVVITDIHGHAAEFEELLILCDIEMAFDTLVFLGDIVDKGPDEERCLDLLLKIQNIMQGRLVWILGNHDDKLIMEYVEGFPISRLKKETAKELLHQHLDLYREFNECVFVHAGYSEENNNRFLNLMDPTVIGGHRIYSGKLFIAGHHPVENPIYIDDAGNRTELVQGMILPEKGAIFFDTSVRDESVANKGKLTALIIENDRIIYRQVDII